MFIKHKVYIPVN